MERTSDEDLYEEVPQLADTMPSDEPAFMQKMIQILAMLRRHARNTLAVMEIQVDRAKRELVRQDLPSDCLMRIVLGTNLGNQRHEPNGVTAGAESAQLDGDAREEEPELLAGEDYRSVKLRGRTYSLSAREAQIVEVLWDRARQGIPEVAQAMLLERIDSQATRVRDVFTNRQTYHEFIKPGKTKGTIRLNLQRPPDDLPSTP